MAGGMHGRGVCVARGHAWQGAHGRGCVWLGDMCMARGHVWQEGGMHGGGHAWQGGMCGRRQER